MKAFLVMIFASKGGIAVEKIEFPSWKACDDKAATLKDTKIPSASMHCFCVEVSNK